MGPLCVSCGYNLDFWNSNYPYASLIPFFSWDFLLPSLITIFSEELPLKTFLSGLGSQLLQVGGPDCLCQDAGKEEWHWPWPATTITLADSAEINIPADSRWFLPWWLFILSALSADARFSFGMQSHATWDFGIFISTVQAGVIKQRMLTPCRKKKLGGYFIKHLGDDYILGVKLTRICKEL